MECAGLGVAPRCDRNLHAVSAEGDLVVLSRGDPNGALGHVGFYAGPGSTPGTIKVMAGNTGNSVSTAEYPTARVLGYRSIDQNAALNVSGAASFITSTPAV